MNKSNKTKIGIIGAGNMGQAILAQSLRRSGYNFLVCEKNEALIDLLVARYIYLKARVKIVSNLSELLRNCNIIIIAVKPQDVDEALRQINSSDVNKKGKILFVSIAAGVRTDYIEAKIGNKVKVIRAMPNMPAVIGEGITVLKKGKFASSRDLHETKKLFECLGPVIILEKEDLINVVTALSGSGPAYLFFIFLALSAASEALGLDKKSTNKLIYHTIVGSMNLLNQDKFDAKNLIKKVASKGGTTEAALKVFKENKLHETIYKAVMAAWGRAKELSR
jgi:pyrroline-5-carboxylate reductase